MGMDHGVRHPTMKTDLKDAFVLTCNCSLEYEKTEVNSSFFYKSAEERERFTKAERKFIDNRVDRVIALKNKVCTNGEDFMVINQKGIDPQSLDMLAAAGISGLRRAKRRNMERITQACGGEAMNTFDDMDETCLGKAGSIYEHVLGEQKYTFVEDVENPSSVTLLIKGPNKHTLTQIKDAVRDGLRAVKNALEDDCVVPGAGAVELAISEHLIGKMKDIKGRVRLGVAAFAEAMLIIPKTLALNGGFDAQESIVKLQEQFQETGEPVGLDCNTGDACLPADEGIFDNYCVKRNMLHSASVIASQLLLVDEVMRAGMSSLKGGTVKDWNPASIESMVRVSYNPLPNATITRSPIVILPVSTSSYFAGVIASTLRMAPLVRTTLTAKASSSLAFCHWSGRISVDVHEVVAPLITISTAAKLVAVKVSAHVT